MFNRPVGIRSLAVSLPSTIRTNDYWQKNYPELVERAEQLTLAQAFAPAKCTSNKVDLFTEEMLPYLSDPFQGSVERRVIDPKENALLLGYRAAREALEAANLTAEEIDLAIVNTLFSEQIAPGDAALLAGKLGLVCPAWNLESACSAAIVALQTAYAQVRSGECRNVLVVISAAYSDFIDKNDTLSFIIGDGASAFVVSHLNVNCGIIGTKIINSSQTCCAFVNHIIRDEKGTVQMQMRGTEQAPLILRNTQQKYLRTCCEGAVAAAGVTLDQINFFAFNTPTAWFAKACTRALGIDLARTIDLHPYIGNIGPVLPPINLYFAAQSGRIRENDLVLLYAMGLSGNAGAIVMRWGDVALGPLPENSEKLIDAARAKVPMAMAT